MTIISHATRLEGAASDAEGPGATEVGSPADGGVRGVPRQFLRVEGATLAAGAFVAYSAIGQSWWLVPVTLLLPDITIVGYLGGARLGSWFYNLGHSTPLAAALVGIGWSQDKSLVVALGLIWLAHIGLDRLLGYGLKYADHFQHTHLGRIGGERERSRSAVQAVGTSSR